MPERVQLPQALRAAEVRPDSYDADANTIEVIWTTGAAVRRWSWIDGEEYDEALSLEPGAVRLERLNAGAPFVDTHATYCLDNVIGSVVPGSARIEDGRGVAMILLSRAPGVADTVQKIREGVIRNISVGYWQHRIIKTESDDGTVARWDVVDWEPLEISAVPVPADAGSQIRSEHGQDDRVQTRSCVIETRNPASRPTTPALKEPPMTTRTAKTPPKTSPKTDPKGDRSAKTAAERAEAERAHLAALREAEEDDKDEERGDDEDDKKGGDEGDDDESRADDEGADDEDCDDGDDDEDDGKRSAVAAAARRAAEEAVKAERSRITTVTALAERAGLPKFGKRHIDKGTPVKAFRSLLLERLLERQEKRGSATVAAAADEHFNEAQPARRSGPGAEKRDLAEGESHWARVAGKAKKAA